MSKQIQCLISAGPTREWLDPVRFISNPSSGKMGFALADAAVKRGMEVTLVSGPVNIDTPKGVRRICVESASQMNVAMHDNFKKVNLTIMTAAVCDHRPKTLHRQKQKEHSSYTLELIPNQDILKSLGKIKTPNQVLVGFAAETENHVLNAERKICEKNLDWIVLNDVLKKNQGFESDYNAVTLLSRAGKKILIEKTKKVTLAKELLNFIWP